MTPAEPMPISDRNPRECTPEHDCAEHEPHHQHGHPAVQHGDHIDYTVAGHLHHPHEDHCDRHGPVDRS